MKKNTTRILLVLVMMLSLCFLCTACGGDSGSKESAESAESAESSTVSPQDDPNEGLGDVIPESDEDTEYDFSMFEGTWVGNEYNQYDAIYLQFDGEGNWELYIDAEMVDEGYLQYIPEWEGIYAEGVMESDLDGSRVDMEGDQLYIGTYGYFDYVVSEDDTDDWDSEVFHKDLSEFKGVWYFDNDLSATMYIVIDGYGNWSYYERVPGDAEGTEMDYGTLSYSADESDVYYADSELYDGLQIRMYDLGDGIFSWNDSTFYWMEDSWDSDFYSWDSELCQRNVSEFEGVWYCDGDLSSGWYIIIDGDGNWSFYERAPGNAEGAEMDYGGFTYSPDEMSTYYAESYLLDDFSYRVVEYDVDTLIWNDEVFYRMER